MLNIFKQKDNGIISSTVNANSFLQSARTELCRLNSKRFEIEDEICSSIQQRRKFSRRLNSDLRKINVQRKLLESLLDDSNSHSNNFVFTVWMLLQTFYLTTGDENENLCLIAGCKIGDCMIGTHIIPIECELRSPTKAIASTNSVAKNIYDVRVAGLQVCGTIHSHPGKGVNANLPSETDNQMQSLWEADNNLISGIWSRDGYLRFFSVNTPHKVHVYGSGADIIENDLYRFQSINNTHSSEQQVDETGE